MHDTKAWANRLAQAFAGPSLGIGALLLGRPIRVHGLAQAFAGPSLGTGALLLGRPMGMWRRPRPPTCHHVPSWHPLSPLGSARGAPLGTTMLDWAQVGTSCPAAQLTHPGSTPLSGKHLAIPKTSPLHLSEPKKTWCWLRYPNRPPSHIQMHDFALRVPSAYAHQSTPLRGPDGSGILLGTP